MLKDVRRGKIYFPKYQSYQEQGVEIRNKWCKTVTDEEYEYLNYLIEEMKGSA